LEIARFELSDFLDTANRLALARSAGARRSRNRPFSRRTEHKDTRGRRSRRLARSASPAPRTRLR